MGIQPLAKNMPLRLTQTRHEEKDKQLFKNKRCKLLGWRLHPDDQQKFDDTTESELVLEHLPEELFNMLQAFRYPNSSFDGMSP